MFFTPHSPSPLFTSLPSPPQPPVLLSPTPDSTSPDPPQGETWVALIGRYQLNSESTRTHRGHVSGVRSSLVISTSTSFLLGLPDLGRNWCLSLPLSSQIFPFITWPSLSLPVPAISLFLIHSCRHFLNRSPRQWLSQARPPSWDQEEANAFLMRPRPQCDTVKWQESVAGEPLVQGIYHLKPSDPLCLWDGGRKREVNRECGRQAEVEEERESYRKAE